MSRKARKRSMMNTIDRKLFYKKILLTVIFLISCMSVFSMEIFACTAIYAGSSVTANGSTYMGRSEDFGPDYVKQFLIIPAADHKHGECFKDDYGFKAPFPSHTLRYSVIMDDPSNYGGFTKTPFAEAGVNEKGVSVSATLSTYFNKKVLKADPLTANGISEISMASYILQSAENARKGVEILAECIDTYGHGNPDTGNPDNCEVSTVLIADRKETWVFEILSGHQYIATRLSDDKVSVLPNDIMTQQINVSQENVIASDGIISTAKAGGFYVSNIKGDDEIHIAKSYSQGYEASSSYRFYYGAFILNRGLAESIDVVPQPVKNLADLYPNASVEKAAKGLFYLQYLPSNDMKGTIDLMTLRTVLASHGEGTPYETSSQNENTKGEPMRSIGTYKQNEEHIFEIRKDPSIPLPLATVEWLAMGPSEFSLYVPFYSGAMTETPAVYRTNTLKSADLDSVYWLFNEIGNAGNGNYYHVDKDGVYHDRYGKVIDTVTAKAVLKHLTDKVWVEEIRQFMKETQKEVYDKFSLDDKKIIELAKTSSDKGVSKIANKHARENAELIKKIAAKKLSEIDKNVDEYIRQIGGGLN